jgi:hypothetical protein
MVTLDLLLPTYRWGPYVRGYISYLAALVEDESYDLRLHIGDNSCNAEKHSFLRRFQSPKISLHLHETNIGVHANVVNLVDHSAGELVQILGDDDWIHPASFASGAFLQQNPTCSSCAGFFAGIPPPRDQGLVCLGDRFMVPDSVARSIDYAEYLLNETQINWLALAVHRRQNISTYIRYMNLHPFPFYFRDQLLSQIALLNGPVKGIREGFMFYNVRSAEQMPAHVQNFKKGLKSMGLAGWLYEYYDYLLACDYAALYLYRGLSDSIFSNRLNSADLIFKTLFQRFESRYRQSPHVYEKHFANTGIRDAMHAVLRSPSAVVGLRSMASIASTINSDAGRRYKEFLGRELTKEILQS